MSIPDFQSFMLPLLKFTADQQEHSLREAIEALAQVFNLSEQERKELLPSGQQTVLDNRVSSCCRKTVNMLYYLQISEGGMAFK